MRKTTVILLSLLLLAACSVQKRRYQKGFFISWQGSHVAGHVQAKKEKQATGLAGTPALKDDVGKALSADGASQQILPPEKPVKLFRAEPDSCDNLVFRTGDEVSAKIIEINSTEIKYKKCAQSDGPLYIVRKSEIFMVRYANGTRETFPASVAPPPNSYNGGTIKTPPASNSREVHPDAPYALAFGITGILLGFGSIAAIIRGSRALRDIKQYPNTYKGEGVARAGLILGIVRLVLLAAVILLIIASAA